jgi:hypothetical protein
VTLDEAHAAVREERTRLDAAVAAR